MSDSDLSASDLGSMGRFRDALSRLRRNRATPDRSLGVEERIELAELLERTGQLDEARGHLAALKKTPKLGEHERARCLLVEGLLSKQLGHLESSIDAFKRACRMAERAGSPELLCWCQLRLLGVSADFDKGDFDTTLLTDLRRNTERAAVPSVAIAYQVFLAEYHAKRGAVDTSWHHSSLAESLLGRHPNTWLRGLLDLHLSCLAYLQGDYFDSLAAARHALDTSGESGHLLTGLIARADMAAAYLAVGQPARARTCLASALSQANSEEQIFGLLLETLAETQLVSGDLDGCAESLKRARALSTKLAQSRSTWHRAWNVRTEARLLQRSGQWEESLSLVRQAWPRDSSGSRSFVKRQIEALEVLALSRMGRFEEARAAILRFVQEDLGASCAQRDSLLAATAALSDVADGGHQQPLGCGHVLRTVGATGETSAVVETVDRCVELLTSGIERIEENGPSQLLDPLWRPTKIVCHLDTSTALLSPRGTAQSDVVSFVTSLADLTANPAALGEESLRCLASMKWIQAGALVEAVEGSSRTIAKFESRTKTAATHAGASELGAEKLRVVVGSRQPYRYELLLAPVDSENAIANCYGVARLIAALRGAASDADTKGGATDAMSVEHEDGDSQGLFRSPSMLALLASAKRVAPLDISVLLTGESGTGKEVVANIIHRASGLPGDAFVAFNCATVPKDMVDSQLFGYRRGAFTGAMQGFKGVISAADGGTLLLDEVGELPLETQPKLLRFLDSGEIQPLGESVPRRVRVRVIAATNADLENLVRQGRFREDLFYRLNVVRLRLPPLRERREEVGPLISVFLSKYAMEFGKKNVRLSDAAREHLLLSAWPGNVRQLSHEIRRLVALSDSNSMIDVEDLDSGLLPGQEGMPPVVTTGSHCMTLRIDRPLREIIQEVERAALANAIGVAGGRLDLAAKRLGLSRKGLYLKRQRLGFV